MEAKLFNQSGAEVGTIQLAEYIFGIEPNIPVMHQAVVRQQARIPCLWPDHVSGMICNCGTASAATLC